MNKNQEEHLKRQIKQLRRRNKELQDGLEETMGLVDAILIQLGKTYGEDRESGWRLEIPVPDLNDLGDYEVKTQRNKDAGSYVIGVFEKPQEGGKSPADRADAAGVDN